MSISKILVVLLVLSIMLLSVSSEAALNPPTSYGKGFKIYGNWWDGMGEAFLQNSTNNIIGAEYYIINSPWDATMNTTLAINATSGAVDFSGKDDETVINSVYTRIGNSTRYKKVVIRGNFTINNTPLRPRNFTETDATAARFDSDKNTNITMFDTVSDVKWKGGIFDGSSQERAASTQYYLMATSNASNIEIDGAELKNGGYYGLTIWQTSGSVFSNINAHHNYDDGIHPGSDTAGWGGNNTYLNINASDNGGYGFWDRGNTQTDDTVEYNIINMLVANRNGCFGAFGGTGGVGLATTIPGTNTTYQASNIIANDNCGAGIKAVNITFLGSNIETQNNSGSGVYLRSAEWSSIHNILSKYNTGTSTSDGGVMIYADSTNRTNNIWVSGGTITNNYRNLYATSDGVGMANNISWSNLNALNGSNANVFDFRVNGIDYDNIIGYKTAAIGTAWVSNNESVSHQLGGAPLSYYATSAYANITVSVIEANATKLRFGLNYAQNGTAVMTGDTVLWGAYINP